MQQVGAAIIGSTGKKSEWNKIKGYRQREDCQRLARKIAGGTNGTKLDW